MMRKYGCCFTFVCGRNPVLVPRARKPQVQRGCAPDHPLPISGENTRNLRVREARKRRVTPDLVVGSGVFL
jgi:hypothetical protein